MGPFSDWIEDLFGKLWDIRNLIDNDVVGLKYYESVGDYVTVAFHLVLIALIVWLADFCGFIGCTMLTMWFWINVVYILVRFIVHMKDYI